ncbi:hypothetical protein GWK08_05370 [Leptobacterium flavescens]|uniref:Sugar-binding protein n=1 Tax=Leptobacterium flavescens TaxID=472055 RepID=A0A6P0ULY3_9FLAO|nr:hypothetical protein [Leptobacterium flavescens]NER12859.1 hypothetical protein [Leptobacterium flavescens]
MNFKIILGLFAILVLSSSADTKEYKNHLEKDGLKGKVKSVEEISYKVRKEGDEVIKIERKSEYANRTDSFISFNEAGNYTEIKFYNPDQSFIGKYEYTYDDAQNNTRIKWINKDGNVEQEHHFKYDRRGNRTEYKVYYTKDGGPVFFTEFYKYDKKDNLLEVSRTYKEGRKASVEKTYQYNKQGDKTEFIDHANKEESRRYEYSYHSKGVKRKETVYDSKGKKKSETNYDPDGRILSIYSYSDFPLKRETNTIYDYITIVGKKRLLRTSLYEKVEDRRMTIRSMTGYVNDDKGNWKAKTTYIKGKARYRIERTIKYY